MQAIIDTATGTIEQIVASADGDDLTGKTVVDMPDDFATRAYKWNGTAIVPDMNGLRAARWEAVKAYRDAVSNGGCETPSGVVQTDVDSRGIINGLVTMAMLAEAHARSFAVNFTLKTNVDVVLSADAAITMGLAVGSFVDAVHQRSVALRADIAAAATPEALAAIDIDSGWPT